MTARANQLTKSFNREAVNGLLLLIVLVYCGVRLFQNAATVRTDRKQKEIRLLTPQSLPFLADKGVDVFGNPVVPSVASKKHPVYVFLLRGDRIDSDLSFWLDISRHTKKENITLIGYCDGQDCSSRVRRSSPLLPFRVIEYGEVTSSQALINADREGYLLGLIGVGKRPKKIKWRGANSTVLNISEELGRQ